MQLSPSQGETRDGHFSPLLPLYWIQAYSRRDLPEIVTVLLDMWREAPGMPLPGIPGICPLGSNCKPWDIDICVSSCQGDTSDLEQATRRQWERCLLVSMVSENFQLPPIGAKLKAYILGSSFQSIQMDSFGGKTRKCTTCLLSQYQNLGE